MPLRPDHETAIVHLCSGLKSSEVAAEMGRDPSTLRRWLQRDDFKAELERRMAFTRAGAQRKLNAHTDSAADVLAKLLTSDDEKIRMGAAKEILDRAGVVAGTKVEIVGGGPPATLEELRERAAKLKTPAMRELVTKALPQGGQGNGG